MIYIEIAIRFFLAGLCSIGGGLAVVPFLYNIGRVTGWYTEAQMSDMFAIANSLPGAIGVNSATYAGYAAGGIPGGIAAGLFLTLPSLIIIAIISRMLKTFKENPLVNRSFYGLRAASIGLIASAAFAVAKLTMINADALALGAGPLEILNFKSIILICLLYAAMKHKKFKDLHPVYFIVFSAVVGIVFHFGGV